jgi:hypothetical protein
VVGVAANVDDLTAFVRDDHAAPDTAVRAGRSHFACWRELG